MTKKFRGKISWNFAPQQKNVLFQGSVEKIVYQNLLSFWSVNFDENLDVKGEKIWKSWRKMTKEKRIKKVDFFALYRRKSFL